MHKKQGIEKVKHGQIRTKGYMFSLSIGEIANVKY